MAETAEFNFDLGLEAANSSMEFGSEVTHDAWKIDSNANITNFGAIVHLGSPHVLTDTLF